MRAVDATLVGGGAGAAGFMAWKNASRQSLRRWWGSSGFVVVLRVDAQLRVRRLGDRRVLLALAEDGREHVRGDGLVVLDLSANQIFNPT